MNLTLEATTSKGVKLIAVGYKYNSFKVLCFVATKNAGEALAHASVELLELTGADYFGCLRPTPTWRVPKSAAQAAASAWGLHNQ
jgi:hypothetical protein